MAFSVEYIYQVIDKMSGTFNKMGMNAKSFQKEIDKAKSKVKAFGASVKRFGAVAIGAAVAGIVKLSAESIKLWDAQAEAVANVNATLESTGGVVGRSLEDLEAQASALQSNTFFGDEEILKGVTSQMLTFTNITEGAFDRAQGAVVDITAKLNGLDASEDQLKGTTIMLSKALNDPVANLSALSRAGIQFTEVQKTQIKGMVEAGNVAGAQSMILDELERQYGGTAAALAQTTEGLERSYKNMRGDAMELIGKGLEPMRRRFIELRTQAVQKLIPYIQKLSAFLEENGEMIADKVVEGFKKFIAISKNVINGIIKIVKFLKPLLPVLLGIIVGIKLYNVVMGIVAVVQMLVAATNPFILIAAAIGIVIVATYMLIKNWDKVKKGFKGIWESVKKFTKKIWDKLMEILDNPLFRLIGVVFLPFVTIPLLIAKNFKKIVAVVKEIIRAFKMLFKGDWEGLGAWASGVWENMVEGFGNAKERLAEKFEGVRVKFEEIFGKIKEFASGVWDSIKDAFSTMVTFLEWMFYKFLGGFTSGLLGAVQAIINAKAWVGEKLGFDQTGARELSESLVRLQSDIGSKAQMSLSEFQATKAVPTATPTQAGETTANMYLDIKKEPGITVTPFAPTNNIGLNLGP